MELITNMKRKVVVSEDVRLGTQSSLAKPYKKVYPQKKASDRPTHIKDKLKKFFLTKSDEANYFAPHTWFFWRGVIMYFFIFSVVGHWLEIPYCMSMHALFGIVADDYAVWTDPIYAPYWVYGVGATFLALLMLPFKVNIVKRRKTLWGACLEFFVIAVVLCAAMETIIGLLINQPDATGEYPYWNNAILPFNILGQGWLVNDITLGVVALIYTWVIFPFCQKLMSFASHRTANIIFIATILLFVVICVMTYAGR